MKVLSLFDGMSCGQITLAKINKNVSAYYAAEIDEDAITVTKSNFPDTIHLGSVTEWKTWDIPWGEIDLLIGGSPCQGFSFAGDQLAFDDPRSKLFFVYVDILEHIKKHNTEVKFLLENVRMKTEFLDVITEQLSKYDDNIHKIMICSSSVTAQLRKRWYWSNFMTSQPQDKNINLCDVLEYGYTERKKARCLLESDSRPLVKTFNIFHRHFSNGFNTAIFKDDKHYLDCKNHYLSNFKGLSANEAHNKIESEGIDISIYEGIRYLNQNELERLQTVPQGYTKILDRNRAASLLGNGWTVDVIAHLLTCAFDGVPNSEDDW